MDNAGALYGTALSDGANGYGSVFKLTPSNGGWTFTSLHDFTGGSDGGIRIATWYSMPTAIFTERRPWAERQPTAWEVAASFLRLRRRGGRHENFGVGGGIRTLDSRSHSPEFYH